MKTTLPVGSIIRYKRRGDWEYRVVTDWPKDHPHSKAGHNAGMTGVGRPLVKGDVIHDVTFSKDDTLSVKKVYTLQEDADQVPYFPMENIPDTTEADLQKSPFAAFGIPIPDFDLKQVFVANHRVVMTDGHTSVALPGMSWSWMQDQRGTDGWYHGVGLTASELKDPGKVLAHAREAVDEFHRQNAAAGFLSCTVCKPLMKSVERPRKRVKAAK